MNRLPLLKSNFSASTTQLLASMCSTPFHSWASESNKKEKFSFVVANSFELRQKAYKLANEAFYDLGYVDEQSCYVVSDHDCDVDTFTLLVVDSQGKSVGTISLYFDKYEQLPCDEVFSDEANSIRNANRRVAEVVRLAVAPEYRRSKVLIANMFNIVHLYAYHIMHYSDLVIEVKQSHAAYYARLFGFQIIGNTKPCSRVNNTVANFLHIELKNIEEAIGFARKTPQRSVYSLAFSEKEEQELIQYILKEHKPMTKREMGFYEINLERLKKAPLHIELSF